MFGVLNGYISSPDALAAIDTQFLVQFVDFVLVFLRHHYHRVCIASGQGDTQFPMASFVSLLVKLTCSDKIDTDVFEMCLEVWSFFLEEYSDISSEVAAGSESSSATIQTATQARKQMCPLLLGAFKQLAPVVLRRIFFQFNLAQLSGLDDAPSENVEPKVSGVKNGDVGLGAQSELDNFTAKVTKLVSKFAQLSELGDVLLSVIGPQLKTALDNFRNRSKLNPADVKRVLHDVSTVLGLLCSASAHFLHQFERYFATAAPVLSVLLDLAQFCTVRHLL